MTIAAGLRACVVRGRADGRGADWRGLVLPVATRMPERLFAPRLDDAVPSPLEPGQDRPPIPIDPVPPVAQFRAHWTVVRLLGFAWRRAVLKWRGRLDEEQAAVMTRLLFERLSGIWIKVGQLMSLRTDMMSEPMCRELSALQHRMRGFPPEVARQVVETELGVPLSRVFASFEPMPFAAASIAQVHRATLLRNNRAVVVKVMRPDVARAFARDLGLMQFLVSVFDTFGLFRRFRFREGIVEMRALLLEETDYRYEAVNLKRMRKTLRPHGVYVPQVHMRLSTQRVLVMEEVPGVLMSDYIRLRRTDPVRLQRWEILNGIEPTELARGLSVTVLRQILEDNEFHGDLHPGNILLLSDNRIALIDFGSVGRLDRRTWFLYRQALSALAMKDFERAADAMLMVSRGVGAARPRRLRREMAATLQEWEFRVQFPGIGYSERSVAAMSNAIAGVMARYGVPLSWSLMRVGRTFSTLDASLQTLAPDGDFMKLCRAYFEDRTARRLTARGQMQVARELLQGAASLAGDAGILFGPGLREQALRLNGMLDRVGRLRLAVLTLIYRGLLVSAVVIAAAFFIDSKYRPDLHAGESLSSGLQHFLQAQLATIPDLHFVQWVLLLLVVLFYVRVVQAARSALLRSD